MIPKSLKRFRKTIDPIFKKGILQSTPNLVAARLSDTSKKYLQRLSAITFHLEILFPMEIFMKALKASIVLLSIFFITTAVVFAGPPQKIFFPNPNYGEFHNDPLNFYLWKYDPTILGPTKWTLFSPISTFDNGTLGGLQADVNSFNSLYALVHRRPDPSSDQIDHLPILNGHLTTGKVFFQVTGTTKYVQIDIFNSVANPTKRTIINNFYAPGYYELDITDQTLPINCNCNHPSLNNGQYFAQAFVGPKAPNFGLIVSGNPPYGTILYVQQFGICFGCN